MTETINNTVLHPFSADEMKKLREQLQLVATELAVKADAVKKLKGEVGEISKKIIAGEEYREIECEKRYDYEAGTITITRKDTGEEIETRPMDALERQMQTEDSPSE